ncbi:hypothetical protein POM88_033236 [Heracleum sosnowskyi]|uniref:SRP9 domain-containing protein n=1 Tax=Heracleum sosnowskyi TaxID=360622 RepID=A0AAD8MM29_9APIA|nr:hypothetical protein POM88_033236 [Heracleum sosnowskyi]
MVYITSWDDFVERSVQLFPAHPDKTRYVMKYRNCCGKLVLKVTDDKEATTVVDNLLNSESERNLQMKQLFLGNAGTAMHPLTAAVTVAGGNSRSSFLDLFFIKGGQKYKSPGSAYVEGDASSASYFSAGAAVTGGTITVEGLWDKQLTDGPPQVERRCLLPPVASGSELNS